MVLSCVLLLYLSVAHAVLALSGDLAARGLGGASVTKRFVSTNLDANLTYVENSGICETTPGVHQVSGYVTVGENMHTVRAIFVAVFFSIHLLFAQWFWFFAARKSPDTAPFTLW